MYPPLGSTFEGRRSAPAAHKSIDTLDDLKFSRPRALSVEVEELGEHA